MSTGITQLKFGADTPKDSRAGRIADGRVALCQAKPFNENNIVI